MCPVGSSSTGMCAAVRRVTSGRGAAEGKARGTVHFGRGGLAAAALAVAANAADRVF